MISKTKRSGKYYFWAGGDIPLDSEFMKRHAEIHNTPYDESYNTVMSVMVTLQDMLLTHTRFMLPGIGVVGIANNSKRGIVIASSTMWWTPGLVNVLACAPGWENAPLNGFITADLFTKLNRVISKLKSPDRKLLSPFQFYNASDFDLEDNTPNSDEKLKYYAQLADEKWIKNRDRINKITDIKKPTSWVTVQLLKERVKYLEGLIHEDIEPFDIDKAIEEYINDKIPGFNS